jgi:hypothetical protein
MIYVIPFKGGDNKQMHPLAHHAWWMDGVYKIK